jgi:hypothetical protein
MSVTTWAEDRARAMTLWDIGFLKVYSAIFGMIIGAYLAPFVLRNIWVFLTLVIVLGARGAYRWFSA